MVSLAERLAKHAQDLDSSGHDTVAAGGVADIVDLSTAETDASLVLAPDGLGGVEFRAEAGGGTLDSDLTDIGALTPSNDDVLQRKAGHWANRTIAQLQTDLGLGTAAFVGTGAFDAAGDAAAAQAASQPLDADLTAIASLTTTAWGRALLELATAAAARAYVGSLSGIYGDGSDGSVTFDGSTTILGMTPSGSTYSMTRDIYCSAITVNNGVTIRTNSYRIFCTGTLDNNGTIHHDGGNASGTTGGAAAARGSMAPASGAGAAGLASNTTTVAGTAATANGSSTVMRSLGGAGGAGGNGSGAAVSPLSVSTNVQGFRDVVNAIRGQMQTSGANATSGPALVGLCGGCGGSSGARTTGGTATTSGAGGGGGGIVAIYARTLDNAGGTIRANGGNGGNAAGGTCVTGGGGGGGGGGVILVYDTLVAGTEQAAGGTKGTGLNGASAAGDGSAGTVLKIFMTA